MTSQRQQAQEREMVLGMPTADPLGLEVFSMPADESLGLQLDYWLSVVDMIDSDLPSPTAPDDIETDDITLQLAHWDSVMDTAGASLVEAQDALDVIKLELAEIPVLPVDSSQRSAKLKDLLELTTNWFLPLYASRTNQLIVLRKLCILWYQDSLASCTFQTEGVREYIAQLGSDEDIVLPSEAVRILIREVASSQPEVLSQTRSAAAAQNRHNDFREAFGPRRAKIVPSGTGASQRGVSRVISDMSSGEVKHEIDDGLEVGRQLCVALNREDLVKKWEDLQQQKADIIELEAKEREYAPYLVKCAKLGATGLALQQEIVTTGNQCRELVLEEIANTTSRARQAVVASLPPVVTSYLERYINKGGMPTPQETQAAATMLIQDATTAFMSAANLHAVIAGRFAQLELRGSKFYPGIIKTELQAAAKLDAAVDCLLRALPTVWDQMIRRPDLADTTAPRDRVDATIVLNSLVQRVMPGFAYKQLDA